MFLEKAKEIICGGYDLHIHTAPSHFPRKLDDFEALKQADDAGIAGILIKSHYEQTQSRAMMANEHCKTKAQAFGGLALNYPVGGFNPYAVESFLKAGGRMVWMPTRDAAHSLRMGDMPGDFFKRKGLSVFDAEGQINQEILEILDIIKNYDACVATGHISLEESLALCQKSLAMGIKTVLTHPDWMRTLVTQRIQKELCEQGVYIEKVFATIKEKTITQLEMANCLRTLNPRRVIMVTDRGQLNEDYPALELLRFVQAMLQEGVSTSTLKEIVRQTPQKLLS
ncbi:DUF6282 family protein [Oscillospiraceae bacterium LTW-04]|nr:DUF6282 family protein [Oscillospiraceae bacterium MB24-C1]